MSQKVENLYQIARQLKERVGCLLREAHQIRKELPELDLYKVDLIGASDVINSLDEALKARCDGRPIFFSLWKEDAAPQSDEDIQLMFWGQCSAQVSSTGNIALVGGTDVTLEDLLRLKTWIDSVIEFHSKKSSSHV